MNETYLSGLALLLATAGVPVGIIAGSVLGLTLTLVAIVWSARNVLVLTRA